MIVIMRSGGHVFRMDIFLGLGLEFGLAAGGAKIVVGTLILDVVALLFGGLRICVHPADGVSKVIFHASRLLHCFVNCCI
jgi:hypothetical protein